MNKHYKWSLISGQISRHPVLWIDALICLALAVGCHVEASGSPASTREEHLEEISGSSSSTRWKDLAQVESDLEQIVNAGYSHVCLFDLKQLKTYPDPRYTSLLKEHADNGLSITVYVQEMEASQETLESFQSIGASSVILYEQDLLNLFSEAGVKTFWWYAVAYPSENVDRPRYMGWPDLRSDQVRQDIADWAVRIPEQIDGGLSLDYIRWNNVGEGRNAEQVTDLVQRIRANWDLLGKGTLSAAVYPYLGQSPRYGGALSVGQKWNEWLQDDLLDLVYPMAYVSEDLPRLIEEWGSYDKTRVVPCLSVVNY